MKDLTTLSEEGSSVKLSFSSTKVKQTLNKSNRVGFIVQEGEVLEVVRMLEGGCKMTSCLDSDGNVVVATVYRIEGKPGEEKDEDKEGKELEDQDDNDKDIKLENEVVEVEKEVWVSEGSPRKESIALPGGKEATALYQVVTRAFCFASK